MEGRSRTIPHTLGGKQCERGMHGGGWVHVLLVGDGDLKLDILVCPCMFICLRTRTVAQREVSDDVACGEFLG